MLTIDSIMQLLAYIMLTNQSFMLTIENPVHTVSIHVGRSIKSEKSQRLSLKIINKLVATATRLLIFGNSNCLRFVSPNLGVQYVVMQSIIH